jgi:hypothetical protein
VKYFFDNCISYRFADMLSALGVDAVALRSQFSPDIEDVDFLAQLTGTGMVLMTADISQATRVQEARALKEAGVTTLFLGPFWSKLKFWDQAVWLVRRWPRIDGFASNVTKGTCAEIKQNGTALVFLL